MISIKKMKDEGVKEEYEKETYDQVKRKGEERQDWTMKERSLKKSIIKLAAKVCGLRKICINRKRTKC